MDVALKQRVVGAIVLVALAVIFLPMLFDGSGRPDRVDMSVEIPAEPDPPGPRTEQPARNAAADRASEDGAAAHGSDLGSAGAGDGDTPAGGEDSDTSGAAGAQGANRETDAERADTGGSGPSAWAVQVGSFAQETNAMVLRDRLRQQGFAAFTEETTGEGDSTMWRVRVGPVPTRERAESLKAELEDQRGKPVLVTTYP